MIVKIQNKLKNNLLMMSNSREKNWPAIQFKNSEREISSEKCVDQFCEKSFTMKDDGAIKQQQHKYKE